MSESLKQKTLKGASWSFVEQVFTRGVNFLIGIILARLLSPTDYGLVGMMGIFIAVAQLFVDGGRSVMTANVYPDPEDTGIRLFSEGGKAEFAEICKYDIAVNENP